MTGPDPALTEAIDAFLLELQVERGLSPLTISAYRRDLGQFAAVAGTSVARRPGAGRAVRQRPAPRRPRPTTQARKVAAIRSFYGFALREGIAQRDVGALLDSPRPGSYLPDVLDPDEVERILDAPPRRSGRGPRRRHPGAAVRLWAAGERAHRPGHWIGSTWTELQVRVIGKGNRERRVPMGEPARERLHRYLMVRARTGPRESRPRRSS